MISNNLSFFGVFLSLLLPSAGFIPRTVVASTTVSLLSHSVVCFCERGMCLKVQRRLEQLSLAGRDTDRCSGEIHFSSKEKESLKELRHKDETKCLKLTL